MTLTPGPSPQPKFHPYLSVIPHRRPEQKTHTSIGHAKNAINGKMSRYRGATEDMQIYEYLDGGWSLLYSLKEGDMEVPWRAGELKEEARKKEAAAKREEERLTKLVRSQAEKKFTEEYGSDSKYEDRIMYVDAYIAGYMQALGR